MDSMAVRLYMALYGSLSAVLGLANLGSSTVVSVTVATPLLP